MGDELGRGGPVAAGIKNDCKDGQEGTKGDDEVLDSP